MSGKDIVAAIEPIVPIAHNEFVKGSAPELPWCVYRDIDPDWLYADDTNHSVTHNWQVMLYQRSSDPDLERRIHLALVAAFEAVGVSPDTYLESEDCVVVTYEFTETEGFDNGC